MSVVRRLLETVKAVVPAVIDISIGTVGESPTVTVIPSDQQAAAQVTIDAFDWSPAAQAAWQAQQDAATVGRVTAIRLPGTISTTSNALGDATGLSFSLLPNRHYIFEFTGAYTTAAGTTGISLAVNGPASPNLVRMIAQICESVTASRNGATGAYNTPVTGANSGGATPLPFFVLGNISTGAAGGTFTLRFATEVNGSQVNILSGSWGTLKAVG